MINWGIIGAGDVAEVKSGPAFNKIEGSQLLAVMRRDEAKSKDFAKRHRVPYWYTSVADILNNQNINAIYIATPPSFHKEIAIAALEAGKDVYLEKPMAMTAEECQKIIEASHKNNQKLSIAHYRRELNAFKKVKEIIDSGTLGTINFARISILQPANSEIIAQSDENWRINPEISGGGLFHDIGPHQIDLMMHYFGIPEFYAGVSSKQSSQVDDLVSGTIKFQNNIIFQGLWSFCSPDHAAEEKCTIIGEKGFVEFSFYGAEVRLHLDGYEELFHFTQPENVQLPMIQKVCDYFMDKGKNPCTGEDGLKVLEIMNSFITTTK